MNKITAGIAGLALAAGLIAGCGQIEDDGNLPEFDADGNVACYTAQGKFKFYDDDCHDEKPRLYTKRELEQLRAASRRATPVKTSGGMQTAGPAKKTAGTTYKNPPARKR